MSPTGEDDRPAADDVGSVGQEAAKLFSAISDWAREQQDLHEPAKGPEGAEEPDRSEGAQGATGPLGGVGGMLRGLDEHLATGAPECRYCPVCQVVHLVRQTSPEVRGHLSAAASSLMQAVAGVLATSVPPQGGPPRDGTPEASGIERIDLDGDDDGDPGGRGGPGGHGDGER